MSAAALRRDDRSCSPKRSATLGILVALEREAALVARALGAAGASADAAGLLRADLDGLRVAALATGMGAALAQSGAEKLIAAAAPQALLAAGFAGALAPELRCGDLVVATSIVEKVETPPPAGPGSAPLTPDAALCPLAIEALGGRVPLRPGPLASAARVIRDPGAKRALHGELGAIAVDLESLAAARAAAANGIPFLALRAILDDAETPIPLDFGPLLDPLGRPRRCRFAAALALRPWAVPGIIRLARCERRAAGSLEVALRALLPALRASMLACAGER